MLLSTIIITYNTREMTLECLRSLCTDTQGLAHEIFIVDNASTDGTLDAIRKEFPQVRLIPNTQNTGFGAANNQAMKIATGKYFLLLNSDAFPKPGAITAPAKAKL
jgi:GT2 family glycosyltransferase